jgi:pimeloyl-ACP methyl ester carboxylesterase
MQNAITAIVVLAIFSVIGSVPGIAAVTPDDVVGNWHGSLAVKAGVLEMRLVFRVSLDEEGNLTALLDSPDQGATDIPVDRVLLDGNRVRFEVDVIAGYYEGEIRGDGMRLEGSWHQAGQSFELNLEQSSEVPQLGRPQEPTEPFPYRSEDVVYENRAAGIQLAGTLTAPDSAGPHPAVILISGSGPQDRDETVFGHRPFLVLADHLTRNGIAVLRVDDRGVGGSTGVQGPATSEDLAEDVLAGIEYLKSRKEIDPERIGLLGHSEGGIIAPITATRSRNVAFIVLLAGPGVTGEEILYRQSALIGAASGADADHIEQNHAVQARLFEIIKTNLDDETKRARLREVFVETAEGLSEEERAAANLGTDSAIEAQVESIASPWFQFFLTYDPAPTLALVECPVLAIIGEKDLQVPARENLAAIKEALATGGNSDYTVEELAGLNHMLQTAETGAPLEYGRIEETMSPVALEAISIWILERVR